MDFPRAVLRPCESTATVHCGVLGTSITPLNLASLFQNPLLPTLVDRPRWGNGVRTMTMLGTVSPLQQHRRLRRDHWRGVDQQHRVVPQQPGHAPVRVVRTALVQRNGIVFHHTGAQRTQWHAAGYVGELDGPADARPQQQQNQRHTASHMGEHGSPAVPVPPRQRHRRFFAALEWAFAG